MQYIIDANVFYEYIGRESIKLKVDNKIIESQKIVEFLDKENFILPYCVFVEIIVHFRNDIKLVRQIINFIAEKKVKISEGILIWMNTDIIEIINYNDEQLKCLIKTFLKNKIGDESKFATTFLQKVFTAYLGQLLTLSYKKCFIFKETTIKTLGKLFNQFWKDEENNALKVFSNKLLIGYKHNKQEQSLKNTFEELLALYSIIINEVIMFVIEEDEKVTEKQMVIKIKNLLEDKKKIKFSWDDIKYPTKVVTSFFNKFDKEFINIACQDLESSLSDLGFSLVQQYHASEILKKFLRDSKKCDKNNFYDLLYIGSFNESSLLITFDKFIIETLKQFSKSNIAIINNFYKHNI